MNHKKMILLWISKQTDYLVKWLSHTVVNNNIDEHHISRLPTLYQALLPVLLHIFDISEHDTCS